MKNTLFGSPANLVPVTSYRAKPYREISHMQLRPVRALNSQALSPVNDGIVNDRSTTIHGLGKGVCALLPTIPSDEGQIQPKRAGKQTFAEGVVAEVATAWILLNCKAPQSLATSATTLSANVYLLIARLGVPQVSARR